MEQGGKGALVEPVGQGGGGRPAARCLYRQRKHHSPPIFYRRPGRFRKVSVREKARTSALRTLMSDQVA